MIKNKLVGNKFWIWMIKLNKVYKEFKIKILKRLLSEWSKLYRVLLQKF